MVAKGNAPRIPGTPRSGKARGLQPNGQTPGVNGTRGVPANVPGNLSALTRGRGTTTVNSTPAK